MLRGSQCFSVVPVFVLIDDFRFRCGIRCQFLLGRWSGVVLIIVFVLVFVFVLVHVFVLVLVFALLVFAVLPVALILPLTTRKVQLEIWLIEFIVSLAVTEDLFGFA